LTGLFFTTTQIERPRPKNQQNESLLSRINKEYLIAGGPQQIRTFLRSFESTVGVTYKMWCRILRAPSDIITLGILITCIMVTAGCFFRAGTEEICHLPEKKKHNI